MPLLERPGPFVAHRSSHVRSGGLGDLVVLGQSRWRPTLSPRRNMLVIVVHGPEGVGASTVAANLAIALTQFGTRVVLMDLDVACPTQHRLFGVPAPVPGLRALLSGEIETAGEALTSTDLKNLYLVASTQLSTIEADWALEGQRRLLSQLAELDTDILLVDGGRGLPAGLGLFDDPGVYQLLVARPELTSLASVHRFVTQRVHGVLADLEGITDLPLWAQFEGHALGEAASRANATAEPKPDLEADIDALLASAPPDLRAHVERRLSALSFGLVGNGVRDDRHIGFVHATSRLLSHRLGVRAPVLGVLTQSPRLSMGDTEGRPFLMSARFDRNSRAVHMMAEVLLSEATNTPMFPHEEGPRMLPARFHWPTENEAARHTTGRWGTLLEGFMRRSPRFEVDWYGTLRLRTQQHGSAARIFEVSEIGASVEALSPMSEGDGGELRLDQVRGAPTLAVRVQRLNPGLNRAGLTFEGASSELRQALVAIARAHQP